MIFVANYKMNGDKNFYLNVNKVINKLKSKDTVILCPPFVYMPFFKIKSKNVFLGAQDVCSVEDKKSTGQISVRMLKEFDTTYCVVGHSERRAMGETNEDVATKVEMLQMHDIIPIVCVGEETKNSKLDVLVEQVKSALSKAKKSEVVFAYEPVWAIGSGEQPTVNKINQAIKLIKETASDCGYDVKILYGGSVNLSNINELKKSNADGFLMGGVSLKLNDFIQIVKGE